MSDQTLTLHRPCLCALPECPICRDRAARIAQLEADIGHEVVSAILDADFLDENLVLILRDLADHRAMQWLSDAQELGMRSTFADGR